MRGECRKCIIEHRCWQAIDFEEKTMKQFRFIVWWKFGYFIVYRWTNTEGTVNLTIIKKKCRNEWLTLWGEAILVRNISPGNSHSTPAIPVSIPIARPRWTQRGIWGIHYQHQSRSTLRTTWGLPHSASASWKANIHRIRGPGARNWNGWYPACSSTEVGQLNCQPQQSQRFLLLTMTQVQQDSMSPISLKMRPTMGSSSFLNFVNQLSPRNDPTLFPWHLNQWPAEAPCWLPKYGSC